MNIKPTLIIISMLLTPFAMADRIDETVMKSFIAAQQQLQTAIASFCANPASQPLPTKALKSVALSWYQTQSLQMAATQFMQVDFTFVFWPDPKDRLRKQVNSALLQSPDAIDWNDLPISAKSLSAIEYIFTQPQPQEHCDWLTSISAFQVQQSTQLFELQKLYEFEEFEMVNALHGTAMLAHSQLREVLSRPTKINWQLAPAWRSSNGWPIQKNLSRQLAQLLTHFQPEEEQISAWKQKLFDFKLDENAPNDTTLIAYDQYLVDLAAYVENTLAPHLDVYLGFNNFDGD